MATKKRAPTTSNLTPVADAAPRPRMRKLTVANFRGIGPQRVEVELDDIVVLVGPNNAGKSSILKAYELVMSDGTAECELTLDDFPNGTVTPGQLPTIELETIVYDEKAPGADWVATTEAGEMTVRERWEWRGVGRPTRRGYNVSLGRWAVDDDDKKMPWGAAGVANARRPKPFRVEAFSSPTDQGEKIVKILMQGLQQRAKNAANERNDPDSDFATLITSISALQEKLLAAEAGQIERLETALSEQLSLVFPAYRVKFDPNHEDGLDKSITLFKGKPVLRVGPTGGHLTTLDRQGSGARRTLLWIALRLMAERTDSDSPNSGGPFVLLLDEPELCLHPSAIRDACRLLYDLPGMTGNWQVVITTHHPCFIDFARDHTSFVRVERNSSGVVGGTTIFRPDRAHFDGDDRRQLKLLNICDPYVAEFFFGGRTVLVEGDTEYASFKMVMAEEPERFRDVHIVRARGKATLVSLAKVLNQFGAPYAVLHDADRPTIGTGSAQRVNSAWSLNTSILAAAKASSVHTRVIASVPNFEAAYLGTTSTRDKPYAAIQAMTEGDHRFEAVEALLTALIDWNAPLPLGAVEWASEEELKGAVSASSL